MTTHSSILDWRIPMDKHSPWGHKELDTTERLSTHIQVRVMLAALTRKFQNFKGLTLQNFIYRSLEVQCGFSWSVGSIPFCRSVMLQGTGILIYQADEKSEQRKYTMTWPLGLEMTHHPCSHSVVRMSHMAPSRNKWFWGMQSLLLPSASTKYTYLEKNTLFLSVFFLFAYTVQTG